MSDSHTPHDPAKSAWYYRFGKLTVIDASGTDRHRVLNNLCTNQVNSLKPGQGKEAFFTDVKGRTIGHGWIFENGDSLRIFGVPGQADGLIPQLDRYVIREDVRWLDRSAEYSAVALSGEASRILRREFSAPLPDDHLLWQVIEVDGTSVQLVQLPWTDAEDMMLLALAADVEQILDHLPLRECVELDQNQWQCKRIRQRTPWYGIDFDAKELPQELDRDQQAICFTKGCYLGQETVARLDAMGQVQKKLCGWTLNSDKIPQSPIELFVGEKSVAKLTSFAIADSRLIAIGLTRRSHFEPGTAAQTADGVSATRI